LEDREDLLELMADEDSFQYIDWEQRKEEEEVERWLQADNAVRLTQSEGELCLGIESRDFPRLVGYINIYYADAANRQGGFTMMVKPNSRRLGYAKEALRGAFVFGFEGINLHRFVVGLDSRNIAACGMLDKVGMRREGEFVKDRCVKGEWVNTVWFALLKEESQKWKSEPRKTQAL